MISVVIPAYNEQGYIATTVLSLLNTTDASNIIEVIVSDGGSRDATVAEAQLAGAKVIHSKIKGRAAQMNAGVASASGSILYFLHADCLPPTGYSNQIINAVNKGYQCGCFQLKFNYDHWFLKLNCWFTRFNVNAVRFGDQSLFVTKQLFQKAGGYDEKLILLEDQEIIYRIKKFSKFQVFKNAVLTSARKYLINGIYKTQFIYFLIYFLYQSGFPQEKLLILYRKLIKQDKV